MTRRQRSNSLPPPCATALRMTGLPIAWNWTVNHLPKVSTTNNNIDTRPTSERRSLTRSATSSVITLTRSAPLTPVPSRNDDVVNSSPRMSSSTRKSLKQQTQPFVSVSRSSNTLQELTQDQNRQPLPSLYDQAKKLYETPVAFVSEPRTGTMKVIAESSEVSTSTSTSARSRSTSASSRDSSDEPPPECTIM
ncbi:hypothetical protein OIO90_002940 [Microbotryomycetes sp. JL221]|nr:hypothetical protein OIO90_002940 [Microbotryomycetes sp. JL221]